jgi:hypothetical protein
MNILLLLVIFTLFYIFRKERFSLDTQDSAYLKPDRKYINQIDYYTPQINLERAIMNSGISSDDINWAKLDDYDYSKTVGILQGNYNRPLIKNINAN